MRMQSVEMNYAPKELMKADRWFYQASVQRALDRNFVGGDGAEVMDRAIDGEVGVLTINALLDDTVAPQAIITLDTVDTNEGRMLRVVSLEGTNMALWLDELIMMLRNIAEDNDCEGVTFTGRNGWSKELDRYGFKTVQRIMRMRV